MALIQDKQTCTWGMACHLAALAKYIGIPFGNIAGPLIIWFIKRGESPFVDEHGKESLNFQISLTIYGIIAAIFWFVPMGYLLAIALVVADIVLIIKATAAANRGEAYRYPFTIRFIK